LETNRWYTRWKSCTFFAAWWTIIIAPMRQAFAKHVYSGTFFWVEFCVELTFVVDLCELRTQHTSPSRIVSALCTDSA
jgi:hypothetical protein